ncbi:MAG: M28 family metallopeptidase [Bacteroidia bacterium]
MFKTYFFLIFLAALNFKIVAQNRQFAQKTIDTLSAPAFFGRGYVQEGDKKAAIFISEQFKSIGLLPINQLGYLYPFTFNVNTFPGKCEVKVDGKTLVPGKDYIVDPACPSVKGNFNFQKIFNHKGYPEKPKKIALLFDTSYASNKNDLALSSAFDLKINLQKKLTWSVSTFQENKAGIEILRTSVAFNPKKISVNIKSKLIEHNASNVIGYIEGTEIKDTFIVLTAHYDHLGMMGKTMFPGANDNASGVAMMLDMANYFSQHPCKYSIAFIAFAGEEAGLIGSKHYTDNPWSELPLGKMKFLINMDLMGSGEKGMAVVNATVFPDYFNKLKAVNDSNKYLTGFKLRGKAANSDHYWFVERGVKGFFFYLMGDYNHYHDINDNRVNLRLGEFYDKSFLLIRDFILSI